jgi:hypothetical protein
VTRFVHSTEPQPTELKSTLAVVIAVSSVRVLSSSDSQKSAATMPNFIRDSCALSTLVKPPGVTLYRC